VKINKVSLPNKGVVDSWFITSDWHSFYFHQPCLNLLLKTSARVPKKNRKLVINGDFLDFKWLYKQDGGYKNWKSHKDGMDQFFVPKLIEESIWGNDMLDTLEKHFSEIIFLEGNHSARLGYFQNKICPKAYRDMFDLSAALKLEERGITHIQYNHWLDIGKASITHGMYHGPSALNKHYQASNGRSVIFGHLHHVASKSFFSRGESSTVWITPCLSTLSPDYLKDIENNWSLGFGELNVISTGEFWYNIHSIKNDMIILPGGKIIQ